MKTKYKLTVLFSKGEVTRMGELYLNLDANRSAANVLRMVADCIDGERQGGLWRGADSVRLFSIDVCSPPRDWCSKNDPENASACGVCGCLLGTFSE